MTMLDPNSDMQWRQDPANLLGARGSLIRNDRAAAAALTQALLERPVRADVPEPVRLRREVRGELGLPS